MLVAHESDESERERMERKVMSCHYDVVDMTSAMTSHYHHRHYDAALRVCDCAGVTSSAAVCTAV